MKNAPCTPLTPEEEAAIMSAFPSALTPEESSDTAKLFTPYVFYSTRPDKSRDCYCTVCGERYNVRRKGNADFFKASHKGKHGYPDFTARDKASCPKCGAIVEVLSAGRFRDFASLCETAQVVRLSVYDGWLLAQAGIVVREFGRGGCYREIANAGAVSVTEKREFHELRRFAFKPGRRNEWQLKAWFQCYGYEVFAQVNAADFLPKQGYRIRKAEAFTWTPHKSVGEAHFPAQYRALAYHIINPGAIAKSDMRYCQYFAWHDAEYGDITEDGETRYHANLCVYLAEYSRRPQMEMLVKLGYPEIVSDLVIRRKADFLNWKADNLADFFGMSADDFRIFRNSKMAFVNLPNFRRLRDSGLVRDMREFAGFSRKFTATNFEVFCQACASAGVSMRRGANYLTAYASRTGTASDVSVTLWKDYLDAARKLGYDLTRDDVRTPKNLAERHDAATQGVQAEADERERKRYRPVFDALRRRYEYGADGLRVVVPTCVADIVTEGKILESCVGGYAARHMAGTTVILFLRRDNDPAAPYVTIEASAENNCAKVILRQVHGYRNDIGAESPRLTHKAFLDKWLAWVHAGSPRDNHGQPVTAEAVNG